MSEIKVWHWGKIRAKNGKKMALVDEGLGVTFAIVDALCGSPKHYDTVQDEKLVNCRACLSLMEKPSDEH